MTKDEIEELRQQHAPWAEPWTEAGLNEPPRVRPGWLTEALQQRANSAAVSPELFRVDGWSSRGGSSGFSWNDNLVSGRKPW
jgi:hypothetical protein